MFWSTQSPARPTWSTKRWSSAVLILPTLSSGGPGEGPFQRAVGVSCRERAEEGRAGSEHVCYSVGARVQEEQ